MDQLTDTLNGAEHRLDQTSPDAPLDRATSPGGPFDAAPVGGQPDMPPPDVPLDPSDGDGGQYHGQRDKSAYWQSVLTGDLSTVPLDVKAAAGIPAIRDEDDEHTLSNRIVRSWAVDHLGITREQAQHNWGRVRQTLARQLSTDEDDRQIFMALSERGRIDQDSRDKLLALYTGSYDRVLTGKPGALAEAGGLDKGAQDAVADLPGHLRDTARALIERGEEDARAERKRLMPYVEELCKGIQGVLINELDEADGVMDWFRKTQPMYMLLRNKSGAERRFRAVDKLEELSEEDRHKVYSMISPLMREDETLGRRMLKALGRGVIDVPENTAQFGANAYASGVQVIGGKIGELPGLSGLGRAAAGHSRKVAGRARIHEELKRLAREEILPVHRRNATWIDDVLIDSAHATPMSALAFGGPVGFGLLATSETGRHMADARQMNPDGEYVTQMGAATGSGLVSALLSLGMSRIGMRIVERSLQTVKPVLTSGAASQAVRSLGHGAAHSVRDLGLMTAENKLQELTQYGAQELAAAATGRDSGVPWEDWRERQMSARAQLREASAMLPLLLIGSGKVTLRHFRNAHELAGDGAYLKKLGVPDGDIGRIIAETNLGRKQELLKESLQKSPLWGSFYLNKKAYEWLRILDGGDSSVFRSEEQVREYLDMGSAKTGKKAAKTARAKGLIDTETAPASYIEAETVSDHWREQAGLPGIDRTTDATGRRICKIVYRDENNAPREYTGSDEAEILRPWTESVYKSEKSDLDIVWQSSDRSTLPARLRESDIHDAELPWLREQYLTSRVEDVSRRPYRMLLLKYHPETIVQRKWSRAKCEQLAAAEIDASRSIVYDGVMRLSEGQPAFDVMHDASMFIWDRWLRDAGQDYARELLWLGRIKKHIDPREFDHWESFAGVRKILESGKQPDRGELAQALSTLTEYYSERGLSERNLLPIEFREICRIVWRTQGDIRTLTDLIPNLPEYDSLTAKGVGLHQAYGKLLRRHLDLTPETVGRYLPQRKETKAKPPRSALKIDSAEYPVDATIDLLNIVNGETIQPIEAADGQTLWRARYPDGRYSRWHEQERHAVNDLLAHISSVFTPEGFSKTDIVKSLIGLDYTGSRESPHLDIINYRLSGAGGRRAVYENLSEKATTDLIRHYYGKKSMFSPGERLLIEPRDIVFAEEIMSPDALAKRRDILNRQTGGDAEGMNIAARNYPVPNYDGILANEMKLYDIRNPLALIEDRAEIVWDRLLRSGQLQEHQAYSLLKKLGKLDAVIEHGGVNRVGSRELFEGLSLLSKEYLMGNIDHPALPPSTGMWARYSLVYPQLSDAEHYRVNQRIGRIRARSAAELTPDETALLIRVQRANTAREIGLLTRESVNLAAGIREGVIPEPFVGMIRDSLGMEGNINLERCWTREMTGSAGNCYPMMERYYHSIRNGTLVNVLPDHIINDLSSEFYRWQNWERLELNDFEVKSATVALLRNLQDRLNDTPEICCWHRDISQPGGYYKLVGEDSPAPAGDGAATLPQTPEAVNDYRVSSAGGLPPAWADRGDIILAIETASILRTDFARRPMPTDNGVFYRERFYNRNQPPIPGVPPDWRVSSPLLSAEPYLNAFAAKIRHQGAKLSIPTHQPYDMDYACIGAVMKNCVLYRDPRDPGHTVRLMPGLPEAPNKEGRTPYVVHCYNGVYLDVNGAVVPPDNLRDSYIPLERFKGSEMRVRLDQSEISSYRRLIREKLLRELCDADTQHGSWWNEETGDGALHENIIRLYEDAGRHAGGEAGLDDPVFAQTLCLVSAALVSPGSFGTRGKANSAEHLKIIEMAKRLRKFYRQQETTYVNTTEKDG